MSSTEARGEEIATRFFRERLAPAAARLRTRNAKLLPGRPDPAVPTYFCTRRPDEAYVFDLKSPLAETLRTQWREYPELAALADELVRLAHELRQREETGEVSPFIYAMF